MADISFDVEGLAELEQQLLKLQAKTGQKLLKSAGRKAMKPVLDDAIAGVNVDTGASKESLSIAAKNGKGQYAAVISVGANRRKGRKSSGVDIDGRVNAKIGAQEYGTEGKRKQKAEPFLRPALDKNASQVTAIFKRELKAAIDKALV
ncbi:MAG: hypothetical protein OQJ91_02765 [Motiliproteus sp.]|nr:hypothetical protein [Motiliproteus sp.]